MEKKKVVDITMLTLFKTKFLEQIQKITSISNATQSDAGLMSAEDKKSFDDISSGALPENSSAQSLTVTQTLNIPGGKIWIE